MNKYCGIKWKVRFFTNNTRNSHPMTSRRDLFKAYRHMSGVGNRERITIPEVCNFLLLRSDVLSYVIDFKHLLIEVACCILAENGRRRWCKLFCRIKKKRPYCLPLGFN